ncbi:hypothetical protein [Saliphagus infecundisoli]|uniref:Uncharacterized protein n=1 Tax=Saliphagus infecundisoli TaxID=1849069 RepID=A0ABD5QCY0_9EURY|nr:hypothetical protein [Saliphagus infecundisoli]
MKRTSVRPGERAYAARTESKPTAPPEPYPIPIPEGAGIGVGFALAALRGAANARWVGSEVIGGTATVWP